MQLGGEELLDVWATDVVDLLELDNSEDLYTECIRRLVQSVGMKQERTWMDLKRAR